MKNNNIETKKTEENKKIKDIRPLAIRIKEYNEAKARIFGEKPTKIEKTRLRYKIRKQKRHEVASASLFEGEDSRFYTKIKIKDEEVVGLLDSGATVTCLGKDCLDLVEKLKLEIKPIYSFIKTADGRNHKILGTVESPIEFNSKRHLIKFYLVPALKRPLFLGADFMKAFKLINFVDSISTNDIPLDEDKIGHVEVKMHILSEENQQKLDEVIQMFPCYTKKGLGKTSLEQHSIETGAAVPIKERHYPVSPPVQKLMYAELERMISLNVIEPSESPWNNRIAFVRKGDKCRLCLDARKLNEVTVKDAYPLPHIDGLLSRLGDTFFISSIDLKDAFWQVPLELKSREKTAFTIPGRPLYQFTVMPFGLCNAAQRLCRLMDKVIPAEIRERVFIYLDDLLIVSPSFEIHLELLKTVAFHLNRANLTINVAKSKFCFKELKYLGYIVGEGKLKTDPSKIEAILKYTYPKTVKQVRSFLGATGWYRKFIEHYATISAPIVETTKKAKVFQFTEPAKTAFDNLKSALVSSPVLCNPDFSRRFFIQCDASDVGIGGVIFQKDDDQGEHPISYFSKKLSSAQKNYSVTERECLAVVRSVEKFRCYIDLLPFTIITDHSSLKWLMHSKDLGGRLGRWSLELQKFDFEIEHRSGSKNIVPDTLSRYDMDEMVDHMRGLIEIESPEFRSDDYLELIQIIKENQSNLPDLKTSEGYIFKRTVPYDGNVLNEDFAWKLWVPTALRISIIRNCHIPPEKSHGGIGKTIKYVKEYFYWPNMNSEISNFVLSCETCKECKASNKILRPPMGKEAISHKPFQRIYIDFLGPYVRSKKGNSFIFVVLDHLTKYVLLKPMNKANSRNVVRFLIEEVFHKFGTPEIVFSDNGKQFTGTNFSNMVESFGINHIRTANYAPQANASERVNQSILSAIRSYLDTDQREWDAYLSEIECALRSSVHTSTGMTPYFALFGTNMVTHASVYKLARKLQVLQDGDMNILANSGKLDIIRDKIRKNLHKTYERNAKTYNIRSREVKFKPGQEVFRRNYQLSDFSKQISAKLNKKFLKCRIVKAVGNSLYEVEDMNGKTIGIMHAKDLKQ